MTKRNLTVFLICIITLIIYSQRIVLLTDLYPALTSGNYRAMIALENQTRENNYKVNASNEEFRKIFAATRVKKHSKSNSMPQVAFEIRLIDNHVAYNIVVGGDNSISVALLDNLNKTRRFWIDLDEQIFHSLYECYLNNGGTNIPEVETYLLEN